MGKVGFRPFTARNLFSLLAALSGLSQAFAPAFAQTAAPYDFDSLEELWHPGTTTHMAIREGRQNMCWNNNDLVVDDVAGGDSGAFLREASGQGFRGIRGCLKIPEIDDLYPTFEEDAISSGKLLQSPHAYFGLQLPGDVNIEAGLMYQTGFKDQANPAFVLYVKTQNKDGRKNPTNAAFVKKMKGTFEFPNPANQNWLSANSTNPLNRYIPGEILCLNLTFEQQGKGVFIDLSIDPELTQKIVKIYRPNGEFVGKTLMSLKRAFLEDARHAKPPEPIPSDDEIYERSTIRNYYDLKESRENGMTLFSPTNVRVRRVTAIATAKVLPDGTHSQKYYDGSNLGACRFKVYWMNTEMKSVANGSWIPFGNPESLDFFGNKCQGSVNWPSPVAPALPGILTDGKLIQMRGIVTDHTN